MSNSSRKKAPPSGRPEKPYKGFPLTPHPSGFWQKKIRGKTHYFGRWGRRENGVMVRLPGDGWKEAYDLYQAQAADLHAGRTPKVNGTGELTVAGLCNAFLNAKQRALDAGDIGARMFKEYRQTTDRIVAAFGSTRVVSDLAAADFESLRSDLATQFGPVRLSNSVQRVRTVFKYGYDAGLLEVPTRFGPNFKKPPARVLRQHRNTSAKRLFSAEEVRQLRDAASVPVKAMILLGVNCGFGNSDVSSLPQSAVDLEKGWITFPRPKTGIERRCPLWPETVAALKAAIAIRPKGANKEDNELVFLTVFGNRWVRERERIEGDEVKLTQIDGVGQEIGKLLRKLDINGRKGLGFYSLRHTFRTVADATRDFPAVRLIMGHVDASIDATYREHIDDDRLVAVSNHVRSWLYPPAISN